MSWLRLEAWSRKVRLQCTRRVHDVSAWSASVYLRRRSRRRANMGMDGQALRRWRLAPDSHPPASRRTFPASSSACCRHCIRLRCRLTLTSSLPTTPRTLHAKGGPSRSRRRPHSNCSNGCSLALCQSPRPRATARRGTYKSVFLQVAAWYARTTEINPLGELGSANRGLGDASGNRSLRDAS